MTKFHFAMNQKTFYVYILSNSSRILYVGMTNDLQRRMSEHKSKAVVGFTSKYNLTQLVHYEVFTEAVEAIAREKQLKGWTRKKKVALVAETNPT